LILLDVGNNNLEDSISSTIENLSGLHTFLVNSNNFSGSIPESLCDIENLDVSNNQFCASQPFCIDTPELMGYQSCECTTAKEMINGYCYSQSDLTILSEIISNADSINMNLDIDSSGIVDPLELGIQKWHSGRLKQLNCYWEAENCNLSGSIPESIGNLTELTNLDLQNNKLTGELPESISNLTNLTNLNISENQLDGSIPDDICTIYSDSTDMDVSNNKFCPPLPDCIDTPDLLGYQECEDCGEGLTQLNGYCYSQIDLDLLQILIVNSNPDSLNITMDADTIAGVQPLELGIQEWRASRIEILDCFWGSEYCNLSSELPTAISNLDSLKYLDLQHNNLRGELPESIGDLTNLTYLNISENQLEGIIPESTCNLSNLQWDSTFSNTASTLFNNQLCPPYPNCDEGPITSEEEQDTSECVE
jgi:Leucine-rich repeat (LRR) protein